MTQAKWKAIEPKEAELDGVSIWIPRIVVDGPHGFTTQILRLAYLTKDKAREAAKEACEELNTKKNAAEFFTNQ